MGCEPKVKWSAYCYCTSQIQYYLRNCSSHNFLRPKSKLLFLKKMKIVAVHMHDSYLNRIMEQLIVIVCHSLSCSLYSTLVCYCFPLGLSYSRCFLDSMTFIFKHWSVFQIIIMSFYEILGSLLFSNYFLSPLSFTRYIQYKFFSFFLFILSFFFIKFQRKKYWTKSQWGFLCNHEHFFSKNYLI